MFYQLKLLCSQKEGIFADVWIAATLGVKRLTKNQIHNTDIVKISKEIEEMIVTQSHHPKKRLSLRLAVILVNGATKIYLQQVITLQEEILSFLCYVRRPIKLTDESIKRPRNVKAKKRPRPKQQPETSNEQEQIEIPPGSYIRKLSDTHYTSAIAEEVERTRIGPGPIEWGDEFIRQIEELAELERIQEGAKETSVVHHEGREIAEVPDRIEAEITTLTGELEKEKIETTARTEQQNKEDTAPIIETPRKKKAREEDEIVEVETPRKKRRLDYDTDENEITNNRTIKNIRRKQVNFKKQPQIKLINRIEVYGNEIFDKWIYDNFLPDLVQQKRKNPDPVNFRYLVSEFFKYESEITPRRQTSGRPLAGTRLSVPEKGSASKLSAQKRGAVATPSLERQFVKPAPPKQLPDIVITSPQSEEIIPEVVPHPQDFQPVERTDEQPLAESVVEVVPQEPLVHEREHDRPLQRPYGSPAESFSSTENRRKTEEERQKRLAKIIHKWNEEEMGEITIEKICPPPINKLNIAKTFSDLLHLEKMGYVNLTSETNSLQLGKIEKGKKLLRN